MAHERIVRMIEFGKTFEEFRKFQEDAIIWSNTLIVTRSHIFILKEDTKISLSDIKSVGILDNKKRVLHGALIALAVISTFMTIYDIYKLGGIQYLDYSDLLFGIGVFAVIIYLIAISYRSCQLCVTTNSKRHILAELGDEDVSLNKLYFWCGMIHATTIEWDKGNTKNSPELIV